MNIDDDKSDTSTEIGSDELLSDDYLRLPESANILVRLHAVRAWLAHRYDETNIEVGEAAFELQQAMSPELQETRPRRRERQRQSDRMLHAQQTLLEAQERLLAYEEAQALLEDCVAHTNGERVLVEYYLSLEELVQNSTQGDQAQHLPRLSALADVQRRIERVGAPYEEE